jgi:hypothetical protein
MKAIGIMLEEEMSLRKALRYSGMSSCSYYYRPVVRTFEPDPAITQKVEEIALQRPSYGTRGGWRPNYRGRCTYQSTGRGCRRSSTH